MRLRAANSADSRLLPEMNTGGSGCCMGVGQIETLLNW
jgi:hypothetical protein